jgi:hypothetical protein
MHAKNFVRHLRIAVCLCVALAAVPSWGSGSASKDTGNGRADIGEYPIVVRLIPFELTRFDSWQLKNHNGQDVLDMIKRLKPNMLNRFFTPRPSWTAMVPMGPGKPDISIADYLTEVNKVCGKDCVLTPKVPLNRDKIWTDQYLDDSLKTTLAMKVTPPIRVLDLDNWFNQPGDYKAELQAFKDMGWKELGFNFTGSGEVDMPTYGLGSFGMAAIHPGDWQIATKQIALMRNQGIKSIMAAIDYPRPIKAFAALPPNRQAEIIETIARQQKELGFRFIYPVIYGGYDASANVTTKDGPYHGKTVFDVIVECIHRDRREGK